MPIFQSKSGSLFNQAAWEDDQQKGNQSKSFLESADDAANQFILLQLSDGDKRVLNTTEVVPKLQGTEKPDINMLLDFEGFKIGSNENIDPKTKATLQLKVGQEHKITGLEKLFYCINGGLDLYNEIKRKRAEPKDFKQSTETALGNKPISLPGGVGQISLNVVKHDEPKWWQKIFTFAKSDSAKNLMSLIGFGGITEVAVNSIAGMLDNLFDKAPEILFQSQAVKLSFTQAGKEELGSDLSTVKVSCLNPGLWVMARKSDYDTILGANPVYYSGFGILAPDGMSEIDALNDSGNNPFSKITYAIIKAKIKEVDLKENVF
ncbi:hypothetical protein [Agriterribacter sp.]|uniref:hypothetical protein n=1 Tax=Agriterribacter sp. TaxID=2821509 RepID=UPI002C4DEE28|nr:hypothetical protein [Agriterribacter sp.]HRO48064.1 hypothetical protein [Agriterribacter sp.]HRQ17253.1 hypothetical protein [Agriterribacter sp.]